MKTLHVTCQQQRYPIYIGQNIINTAQLAPHIKSKQVLIVTDKHVAPLYLGSLKAQLSDYDCHDIILPGGEANKTLQTLTSIFDKLTALNFHRDATLIALGGGIIGDITGFAAASYLRGIPFIQIPSTLLAQTDSSIGGKTAVNFLTHKNHIGAFYQPQAVFVDIDTLQTLPAREFSAGFAEIVKHGLIADAAFFHWLKQHLDAIFQQSPATLIEMLERSINIKRQVVEQDEKEQHGIRELLNFGHTFAHGIEGATHYQTYLHGEAVSIGMVMACHLSQQLGNLQTEDVNTVSDLLKTANLPIALDATIDKATVKTLMAHDKKHRDGEQRFVLLKNLGNAYVCAVDPASVQL